MSFPVESSTWLRQRLLEGLLIPAHPLALTRSRRLDPRRQRALTRYYHAAGAGGIAVGVHTTQFEIRSPRHALFQPVLKLASETIQACDSVAGTRTVRIAGVCGRTRQALKEAAYARETGYDSGLVSLSAFRDDPERDVLRHCQAVANEIPVFGFYLQPAVGGRALTVDFWRRFAQIESVVAIKIAAFDRYKTLDVVRAVVEAGRTSDIALYTGNDDHIVLDLVSPYEIPVSGRTVRQRLTGGLLGHWACWTHGAHRILEICKQQRDKERIPSRLLSLAGQVTDCNAAFFDPAHGFAGCIAGIHEVLRRQGLLSNLVCLDPQQGLSPGQKAEIDRVYAAYPELNDDAFVREHLDEWMR